ncbi:MAG: reverse transcriptase family protein [Bacteroidales bacterium]
MNSSLYKQAQLKHLCAIIGCQPNEVEYITSHSDDYYNEWFEKKINKSTGDFKKYKDGTIKQRAIRPSLKRLKIIQSSIKNQILVPISLPDNIHGGVKGRSNITNAKPHQGNKYQFTTDLQEFYPSIKHKQVYHTFLLLGFSDHKAHWLTKLTTWKYELPQGTPTSPHIANLVFLETDKKLISLCRQNNLTYTRYVDDLTFSSQQDFKPILNNILEIIKEGGFNISYRKTKYKGDQTVTGINLFLNCIDAPEKIKVKAAAEKITNSKLKPYSNYLQRIRGTNKNILKARQSIIKVT